jgi:hypothetical protein
MWKSGMMFRQRSADVTGRRGQVALAERHLLGPRGRAGGVQYQADVVRLREVRPVVLVHHDVGAIWATQREAAGRVAWIERQPQDRDVQRPRNVDGWRGAV